VSKQKYQEFLFFLLLFTVKSSPFGAIAAGFHVAPTARSIFAAIQKHPRASL
jgi:hypothetical protein